jgi:hypothetical protein
MTEPVKVPLVWYDEDGTRHVIGTAEVDGDQVRGSINQDTEESRHIGSLIAPGPGHYSIGMTSEEIKVKAVPYEVAYIPPLQLSGEVPPVERLEKYFEKIQPKLRNPEELKKLYKSEREQTPNAN